MSVAFYSKIFGLGVLTGATIEVMLIKSNYYEMLAASEAKSRAKAINQEKEDQERFQRLSESGQSVSIQRQEPAPSES
ncbi:hypothetical protein BX666DRAFT_1996061 [Dichotomocladium elegans]|nr:hypothetical protein BX666DRAFT_1996061 [Dichotomocladium elegans]